MEDKKESVFETQKDYDRSSIPETPNEEEELE